MSARSKWTHSICTLCWGDLFPDRAPHRVADADVETCCRCRAWTPSGIYVRGEPGSYAFCAH